MPRRPTRTVPTVIVPGWGGLDPDDWQAWLDEQLRAAGRQTVLPQFTDLEDPDVAAWLPALRAAIAPLPADGYDVVAHSLGAVLWLHHVNDPGDAPRPSRVLLVSPPDPGTDTLDEHGFFPPPLSIDRVRAGADGTALVAGDDDPWLPGGVGEAYGRPLRIATTVVSGGKHLNAASGYGPWPAVLDWCGRDNLAFIG